MCTCASIYIMHACAAVWMLTPAVETSAVPQLVLRTAVITPLQVGRSAPADILLPIPTVSHRHALLRVGELPAPALPAVLLLLLFVKRHWLRAVTSSLPAC